MMSCKEVSQLVSESLDHKLTLWQRMQVGMHLLMCGMCARCRKQISFVHAAAKRYMSVVDKVEEDSGGQLTPEARERIKQSLKFKDQ